MQVRRKFRLFRVFGFEVGLDPSWLVIATLVVWSLAAGVFPYLFEGYSTGVYWMMAVVATIGLFFSIVAHELSHSLAARRLGMQMRGITLFIFGGLAEMEDEPPSPKAEALMALAGPAMSIVLGGIFYGAYRLMNGDSPVPVSGVIGYLGILNLALAAFNLVPAFPLDGGRVLRALLWGLSGDLLKATRWASGVGVGFAWMLVALGTLRVLQGIVVGGIWWILIGLFMRSVAGLSYRQLQVRTALRHETVARFTRRDLPGVPAHISLRNFADDYLFRHAERLYPVVDAANVWQGCIGLADLKRVPQDRWHQVTVGEMAAVCEPDRVIGAEEDAERALRKLSRKPADTLFVAEGDQLVGTVSRQDLVNFVAAKLELEGGKAAQD